MAFFIDFGTSQFLKSSVTGASPNRLNWRAQVLLVENQSLVQNKRVLDLGSHDGRFSYACLKLGARSITGIEGRPHLVNNSISNLKQLGYSPGQYEFIQGDVFDELPRIKSGSFDTVLCFGFFYHTTRQAELLAQIVRIQPANLILDTTVDLIRGSYLKIGTEDYELEPNTIAAPGLVGIPSKGLVELLFKTFGFKFTELQWRDREITDWTDIEDYQTGSRLSYLAELAELQEVNLDE
jgi:SAM-dependent methyltransferase